MVSLEKYTFGCSIEHLKYLVLNTMKVFFFSPILIKNFKNLGAAIFAEGKRFGNEID